MISESEERELRKPQAPSHIYSEVDDRGLQELQASTLYKLLKAVDKLVAAQKSVVEAVADIADDVESITDVLDTINIPAFLRKPKKA